MNDYYSEAEYLSDLEADLVFVEDDREAFKEWREESIIDDFNHYLRNKKAKVGEKIVCAENRCNTKFMKKSYQQAFCCTKHKDQFWNRQKLIIK